MKCHKCNHENAREYFEANLHEVEGKVLLCAKCYSETLLASPPYFRSWFSNYLHKLPVMEHYIAANVLSFLIQHQLLIANIIETQHNGRLPSSITFNVTRVETEIVYWDGEKTEEIKNTYFAKLILLWKEIHKSLELSLNLVFNNYDRAAVAELRFVFEKYIDFAYLLLPSSVQKSPTEITFPEWVAGGKFKSSMKKRCNFFNDKLLLYKPYDLYGLLCKGSHGSMTFLKTQDIVFSSFDDFYNFFKYLRWFCSFLWVLEVIHDINLLFAEEFNIVNEKFNLLQGLYTKILDKYQQHITEIKENRFFVVEYPNYEAEYWLDFEGLVRHKCKGKHKKLLDDYLFSFSLANQVR